MVVSIKWLAHAGFQIKTDGKIIYIDPYEGEYSEKADLILVTHSPHLLDHVEPEEVYVVEKPGRETVVKKLSNSREMKAVKKFLQEGGTLGEAWYSGAMGGVP